MTNRDRDTGTRGHRDTGTPGHVWLCLVTRVGAVEPAGAHVEIPLRLCLSHSRPVEPAGARVEIPLRLCLSHSRPVEPAGARVEIPLRLCLSHSRPVEPAGARVEIPLRLCLSHSRPVEPAGARVEIPLRLCLSHSRPVEPAGARVEIPLRLCLVRTPSMCSYMPYFLVFARNNRQAHNVLSSNSNYLGGPPGTLFKTPSSIRTAHRESGSLMFRCGISSDLWCVNSLE